MIIDANRAGDFSGMINECAKIILLRIAQKKVKVAVGGQLMQELSRTALRGFLLEWSRNGQLRRIDETDINHELHLLAGAHLVSNDIHVIALARASRTRLVFTDDNNLITDFKNTLLISPKGKVICTSTDPSIARKLLDIYAA
ncbi:MAG: hypothetical protein RIM33_14790 [Alphaproteobacteria bacterium]